MNMLASDVGADGIAHLPVGIDVKLRHADNLTGPCRIGIRPGHLRLVPRTAESIAVPCRLELAELSGSETFLHVRTQQGGIDLVAQLQGVHQIGLGTLLDVFLDPNELFVFGADAKRVSGPEASHGAY
jgi:glycerol transport system ATP-binding protein